MATPRLLLIDPDTAAAPLDPPLLEQLSSHHVDARVSTDAAEGILRIGLLQPDLVVLSTAVTDLAVCAVVARIRATLPIPVLVGVLRAQEESERTGMAALAAGATAVLARPFTATDLAAIAHSTVRANRERHQPMEPRDARGQVHAGPLVLDPGAHRAWLGQQRIELTLREFDLLYHLADHAGRVVPREELWSAVWHRQHPGSPDTIGLHVRRLRAKLAGGQHPLRIRTVRGSGYVLSGVTPQAVPSELHRSPCPREA